MINKLKTLLNNLIDRLVVDEPTQATLPPAAGGVRYPVQVGSSYVPIYTNTRGYAVVSGHGAVALDGHFDGYTWQAWSGDTIAYGTDEEDAIENCIRKLKAKERR